MKHLWWKILAALLMIYTIIAGFLAPVPRLPILHETVRNLHFHVPMWFGMILILGGGVYYSFKYLNNPLPKYDAFATECVNTGLLFGMLGMASGMIWAQFAWGKFWSGDPKQNASAVGLLIYFGYLVLRDSFSDETKSGRISAIYNIFAYCTFIPLIFILPRLTDSLHPGNGGNPGFNAYDMDAKLRVVFYPAVIGWTLLGAWITQMRARLRMVKMAQEEKWMERQN
ncbi:MAG: cytochrome c biogenesis protein CcsA [Flammeovirgaceae bacterium]